MTMWCLETPEGELVESTVAETRNDCWGKSFAWVGDYFTTRGFSYKRKTRYDFCAHFYYKWDSSVRCAEREGFEIVEVKLIKAPS